MSGPGPTLAPLSAVGRLARLRDRFATAGDDDRPVDALLVTSAPNIRWLTGFSGSAGHLLVTADTALLTTDGRYRAQAAEQLDGAGIADAVEVVIAGTRGQQDALVDRAGRPGTLGLEAEHMTWSALRVLEARFEGTELSPTSGVVEAMRQVKDDAEVERMQRAAGFADRALAEVLPLLVAVGRGGPALTEAAFAAALDHAMREAGAEDRAFETIVASGEHSAMPHARPTARRILPGDPVVVDFGAVSDGYRSDMTRTFCVGGEPVGALAELFEAVLDAQRLGVGRVVPGATGGEVDDACRAALDARGLAERFEHGTGHGVGLEIHEAPAVGPGATAILAPGTVVTVEPGVYVPGTGGVRIEDTLVVTDHGCRPLTRFPKEVAV